MSLSSGPFKVTPGLFVMHVPDPDFGLDERPWSDEDLDWDAWNTRTHEEPPPADDETEVEYSTDQCDFSHEGNVPAVDSHAGEVFYCEDHRALVLKAFESGALDDPSYTIEDIEAEGE